MKVYTRNRNNLPSRAGMAQLVYKDIKTPIRNNDIITLPTKKWDMHMLNDTQFLCIKRTPGPLKQTWFGGTDEKPFLAKMNDCAGREGYGNQEDWLNIWRNETFYETIIPDIIKKFEKEYGANKFKRQGDIFAYPMPIQDMGKLFCFLQSIRPEVGWRYTSNYSVFGTRHKFSGHCCTESIFLSESDNQDYFIGKGEIINPDHKPLVLKEVHVLAQTKSLHSPRKVD